MIKRVVFLLIKQIIKTEKVTNAFEQKNAIAMIYTVADSVAAILAVACNDVRHSNNTNYS